MLFRLIALLCHDEFPVAQLIHLEILSLAFFVLLVFSRDVPSFTVIFLLYFIVKMYKNPGLRWGGSLPGKVKHTSDTIPTGPFFPLAFIFSWQAVPGPVLFYNLLSVGQFMRLQPTNLTSTMRVWHEFTFHSSGNRGLATSPTPSHSANANPNKHATAAYI